MNRKLYLLVNILLFIGIESFSQSYSSYINNYYNNTSDNVEIESKLFPGEIPDSGQFSTGENQEDDFPFPTPMVSLNNSWNVGATTGFVDVSSTGAATYQIPIEVPQGIAGFEPSVTVNYNSQSGVGLLGYGWNLNAFSSIFRTGKTFYHDNAAEAPQLSIDDNLMLDGKRLILISGQNLRDGAEYRLEDDPFTKIVFKINTYYKFFEVKTKDGITHEFGSTANSNIDSSHATVFWLLSKTTDKNDNPITYEYNKVANNGEFYLTKIQYATDRSILFTYHTRDDKQTTYLGGAAINSTKRLTNISTYIGETRLKQYQFNYVYDGFYSKLTEIIEYGQGKGSSRYNSTLIDYGKSTVEEKEYFATLSQDREGNRPLFIDFNGDGKTDFLSFPDKTSYTSADVATLFLSESSNNKVSFTKACTLPTQTFSNEFIGFLVADLNGDGKMDVVNVSKAPNGTYRYNYYMFDGEKFTYDYKGFNTDGDEAIVGDFTGDGKHEILIVKNQKLFNGDAKEIASGGIDNWGVPYDKKHKPNNRFLCDFNGNGKTNILVTNASEGWVYELSGKSFIKLNSFTTSEIKNYHLPYFGDFNGDGKTDILIQNNNNFNDVSILFSTGKEFVKQKITNPAIKEKLYTGDFNNDGRTDIFQLETINNSVRMTVGTFNGTNFTTTHYSSLAIKPNAISDLGNYESFLLQVGDFDGDGRAEFCCARYMNTCIIRSFTDPQTLLTQTITNGLGIQTSFKYGPITDATLCSNTDNNPVFPVVSNLFPLYVVKSVQQSIGNSYDSTTYRYKNPKVHLHGKGFLGFGEITIENTHKNKKTVTQYGYNPSYYNTFITEQKVTTLSGANISTSTFENTYIVQGPKRIVPYVKKQIDTDHLTGTVKTTECTKTDTWGSPLQLTVRYGNDVTETFNYKYFNSETDNSWIFGLPLLIEKVITKGSAEWSEKEVFGYNSKALPKKVVSYVNGDKLVGEKSFLYDKFGNITRDTVKVFKSSNPLITNYKYSTNGVYMTEMTDPMSLKTSWKYNTAGLVSSSTDIFEKETTYVYDGMGRLIQTTHPDKTVSSVSYTWASPVANSVYCVTESGTGQPTVKTHFDAANRELRNSISRFDGTEIHQDKKYDAAGRLYQESLPFKGTTASQWNTYTYDDYGRITKLAYASGKIDTYSYSGKSITTVQDGISTQKTFNSKGEVVSASDPGGTITYNLRPDGLPSSIIAPGNIVTSFGYDVYGRKTEINDPSAGKIKFSYDDAGNLEEEINANRKTKKMEYDEYGRITSKRLPELTTTYEYDEYGSLISETSTNSTSRTYKYDEYGRIEKDRDNGPNNKWLEKKYTYSAGNLSSIEFTSQSGLIGKENYSYSNGELTEIKLGTVSIWKLDAENGLGLPTSATTGPITRTYAYNAYGIPTERKATSPNGGTLQHYSYSFDTAKGNLTSRSDTRRGLKESFAYDNLNRLTKYQNSQMEYDNKGNITQKHDVGSVFFYNTSGKPYAISRLEAGTKTAIAPRNQSITHTSFERPASLSENNYEALFTYDGNGNRKKMRIKKNGNIEWERYYLGERYEADFNPTIKQILYIGGDAYSAPAAYVNEGSSWALYYICRDYLGSITQIVNDKGTMKQELSYDAWGRLRNPSYYDVVYTPGDEPYLFLNRGYTGHEHLNTFGLINMNARLYDPALGRFISPDPYVQFPDFTQNLNRYAYGMNNPFKYVDPDGELVWFVIPLVAAVIGGTANLVANWKNINGFWQGLATFGVGAGAGFATAATAGAGATALGVAGVAAASSTVTGATNSIVAQTGTNFSGFNNINWGQVGINSAVSGVAGFAGGAAGGWAANSSWVVNGISHPLVKSAVVSPISAGAGHVAGGTTAGLFQGQSLGEAFGNSFNGIGQSMAMGGAMGVGSTAGMMYLNGINPITGLHLKNRTPLPDYIYSSKARKLANFQNETDITGIYINDKGKLQPWNAKYDHYGRLLERTDFNAINRAKGIPNIHHHQYEWLPKGQLNTINHIPGIGPKTGWKLNIIKK